MVRGEEKENENEERKRCCATNLVVLPTFSPIFSAGFINYLRNLSCSSLTVTSALPGSLVFPRVPLITVSGPLGLCQLLETTLLTLINYPTLIATNATRFRLAAGPSPTLLEFGLRRAQGPDGGCSASKYAILGGFDGTSNVTAGWIERGLKVSGTMAHSYVMSFRGWEGYGGPEDFAGEVREVRDVKWPGTNEGELRAFVEYAQCFPKGFLALVDTYDTMGGVYNFCSVAVAMGRKGLKPVGVRLDSGDLAYLSRECRRVFNEFKASYPALEFWDGLQIVVSNDINEEVLVALGKQEHCITAYGIGTNLVTCQAQPALGCVYKLVEVEGEPRIKVREAGGQRKTNT
jgi:nicotinate phosphoribosyltransferase